ncbi:MAG TPA: class I SAM-dependent methyltransferase, partial [Gemmatimonadales bacterium]|nr:class I SAM-dependent methyltransferase [Gemmatimonadales bacterium]
MTDRPRRFAVPFDPEYFGQRARSGQAMSNLEAFRHIHATNLWAGPESRSGLGAGHDQTAALRAQLPALLARRGVRSLLDLPCGDGRWMATVDLGDIRYLGADLLPELIADNARRHAAPGRDFRVLDLLASPLPAVDLVLCRDCLVHLSFADIARAVANLRRSGSRWLLTTTFPAQNVNEDVVTGDWRPINLQAAPFDWPAPEELLVEQCTEADGRFA